MTHIDCAILNTHATFIYLRFFKGTNFYVVKQKNLEWLCFSMRFIIVCKMCFFQARKLLVKYNDFCQNLTFQNLLKEQKILPTEKF